jgi:hypothetical protein
VKTNRLEEFDSNFRRFSYWYDRSWGISNIKGAARKRDAARLFERGRVDAVDDLIFKETLSAAAAQAAREQQLRTREIEAVKTLEIEQSRWVELNNRLDELERLLAPAQKPQ